MSQCRAAHRMLSPDSLLARPGPAAAFSSPIAQNSKMALCVAIYESHLHTSTQTLTAYVEVSFVEPFVCICSG